ncbi:alpha/beta hydrolase [Pseudonocardia sp. MH-G8]|uniref:alpha/beta hydrolase n=1 Tax=Pseudonocardia sp. MH-G8 TaxID=1854588 RepID=UPI000BA0353B|nr:lysophospholipase [Pseudonocardia sp. MH-G8]OZM77834.1 lysophospholipase [Pseudonocardia sp. MH-G8]
MTLAQHPVQTWSQPAAVAPRGTLVVVPGRGEHPGVYERFGLRLAADGYPVHAVGDPVVDAASALAAVRAALADAPRPHVLVGSDTGGLWAAGLVADGEVAVEALVLAGLPGPPVVVGSWEEEVLARTACPTHQGRLTADPDLRRGALREPVPEGWTERARPTAIAVPVLGLHGEDDSVSPFGLARAWYADLPAGRLVRITAGRHDALNDQTHRSAAATVVLFLEQLRSGPDLAPIAVDVR